MAAEQGRRADSEAVARTVATPHVVPAPRNVTLEVFRALAYPVRGGSSWRTSPRAGRSACATSKRRSATPSRASPSTSARCAAPGRTSSRRDGTWVYYELEPHALDLARGFLDDVDDVAPSFTPRTTARRAARRRRSRPGSIADERRLRVAGARRRDRGRRAAALPYVAVLIGEELLVTAGAAEEVRPRDHPTPARLAALRRSTTRAPSKRRAYGGGAGERCSGSTAVVIAASR